jgi:mannose-6-phosphate isomerase-like protein (cupin superfamily)
MRSFETMQLPYQATTTAPDGADVRVLLRLHDGGMAHFQLAPGQVAAAVTHRTVEEIWYVLSGRGELWRRQDDREEVVVLEPGVCVTIPLGTHFQFKASVLDDIEVLAVTMPPWPGDDEAIPVQGPWKEAP